MKTMPGIRIKDKMPFEVAMRKFKKAVEKAGTLQEIRNRQEYEKPSIKRKRAKAAAKKRAHRERIQNDPLRNKPKNQR